MRAKHALYQLSYTPISTHKNKKFYFRNALLTANKNLISLQIEQTIIKK